MALRLARVPTTIGSPRSPPLTRIGRATIGSRAIAEGWLYSDHAPPPRSQALFAHDPPRTPAGSSLWPARRSTRPQRQGDGDRARAMARHRSRRRGPRAGLSRIRRLLTRADHKYRADRLLYAEKIAAALRAAALAGADEVALRMPGSQRRGPLSPRRSPPCRRAAGRPRPALRARPGCAARRPRPRPPAGSRWRRATPPR